MSKNEYNHSQDKNSQNRNSQNKNSENNSQNSSKNSQKNSSNCSVCWKGAVHERCTAPFSVRWQDRYGEKDTKISYNSVYSSFFICGILLIRMKNGGI